MWRDMLRHHRSLIAMMKTSAMAHMLVWPWGPIRDHPATVRPTHLAPLTLTHLVAHLYARS